MHFANIAFFLGKKYIAQVDKEPRKKQNPCSQFTFLALPLDCSMTKSLSGLPVKKKDLSTRELGKELVIVDKENNQVHSLNETATMIWHLCDGKMSKEDMAGRLREKFHVDRKTAESDVEKVLVDFLEKDLVRLPVGEV